MNQLSLFDLISKGNSLFFSKIILILNIELEKSIVKNTLDNNYIAQFPM